MTVAETPPRAQARATSGTRPIGVVDIGSNSVRLVIFERRSRAAAVLHNEKVICAIGRNMVRKGRLDEEGIKLALEAFERFHVLCEGHGVKEHFAVATAAVRDAENGRDFVRRAEKALGCEIQVLSGEDEARIAAEGVLAGVPEAEGLVADLGGGSLDMARVAKGATGEAATLPYGPLRLMDLADENMSKARDLVEKSLDGLALMRGLKGHTLYAVGGIWRALARLDMEKTGYPLHVLHHYVIPASRALKLCKVVAGLGRKSLEKIMAIPRRRAEALPYGAVVMDRLIQAADLKEIVISAYGLREGVFFRRLSVAERAKDPLLEYASGLNARVSRTPKLGDEIFHWMAPLVPGESRAERRVRHAACLMSDAGWRRHPDDRASGAFAQVLRAPYAGADHHERAMIATAIFYRYAGDADFPEEHDVAGLLGEEGATLALRMGLTMRLAYALTGAMDGELPNMPLKMSSETIALTVPNTRKNLMGEIVAKRLDRLAGAFGRKAEVVFR
ncbi:MAG: Ppx/GppA phosphatase family protein [Alphaproteobacteria bacterium]